MQNHFKNESWDSKILHGALNSIAVPPLWSETDIRGANTSSCVWECLESQFRVSSSGSSAGRDSASENRPEITSRSVANGSNLVSDAAQSTGRPCGPTKPSTGRPGASWVLHQCEKPEIDSLDEDWDRRWTKMPPKSGNMADALLKLF